MKEARCDVKATWVLYATGIVLLISQMQVRLSVACCGDVGWFFDWCKLKMAAVWSLRCGAATSSALIRASTRSLRSVC
jgi:hypothetical protein